MIIDLFREKTEYMGLSSSFVGFGSFQAWRFRVKGS